MLSLKQMELLHRNAPSLTIEKYTNRYEFLLFFLTHLQSFFYERNENLQILEPLFEVEAGMSQVTTIGVNGQEFGKVYFLTNEYSEDITFFFHSEEFAHKFFLLENELIEEVPIHTYYFWLNSLFGIFVSYEEDIKKRNKKKER